MATKHIRVFNTAKTEQSFWCCNIKKLKIQQWHGLVNWAPSLWSTRQRKESGDSVMLGVRKDSWHHLSLFYIRNRVSGYWFYQQKHRIGKLTMLITSEPGKHSVTPIYLSTLHGVSWTVSLIWKMYQLLQRNLMDFENQVFRKFLCIGKVSTRNDTSCVINEMYYF